MSDEIQKSATPAPASKLNGREQAAYNLTLARKDPPLLPSVQVQFFELFLNGKSCEDIHRLNPGFYLGMIVRARIENGWDAKKAEYIESLLNTVRERVQQITIESVHFVSDLLAAANKASGDRIRRFLQTGNEAELGALAISNLRQYKEAVELLQKLTGQEGSKKVSGEVTHTVRADPNAPLPPASAPVTSAQAAKILEVLTNGGKKDDE